MQSKTNPICREYKKINNMNIKHLTVCLFAACSLQASAQYLEHIYDYIENTTVFEENQEEGHAYYLAKEHLSLNGDWRFFFANTPEEVPQTFFKTDFKDSVPQCACSLQSESAFCAERL